jgi:single-stranded DNA-binding protein
MSEKNQARHIITTEGFIARDPETKYSTKGTGMVTFSLAPKFWQGWKKEYDEEYKTIWAKCTIFCDDVNDYDFVQARKLYKVTGELKDITVWEDKPQMVITVMEIEEIELPSKSSSKPNTNQKTKSKGNSSTSSSNYSQRGSNQTARNNSSQRGTSQSKDKVYRPDPKRVVEEEDDNDVW